MTLPVSVPFEFGNLSGLIPLSDLDANFNVVTDTLNGINNGSEPLTNVTVTGGIWQGSPISVSYGGTGLPNAPTNGQLLIGNGTSYTLAQLTAGNNVTITNGVGSIQIDATGGSSAVAIAYSWFVS